MPAQPIFLRPGLMFVGAVLCLVILAGCGKEKPQEPELPRVQIQEVKTTEYAAAVALTGDVQARVQTQLSFRVSGKIIQRMVDVGDRVSARQVLAKLDPKDLQTNVDSAIAAEAAEQARVKQTSAAFVRQQRLLMHRASSLRVRPKSGRWCRRQHPFSASPATATGMRCSMSTSRCSSIRRPINRWT